MIAGSDDSQAAVPARSRRGRPAMLLGILITLAIGACGGGSPLEAPGDQRYGYAGANVVLAWDPSADAEYYAVYYADSLESGCHLDSAEPNRCVEVATDLISTRYSHSPPGPRGAGAHYYWVVACNSKGCSEIDGATPEIWRGGPITRPTPSRTSRRPTAKRRAASSRCSSCRRPGRGHALGRHSHAGPRRPFGRRCARSSRRAGAACREASVVVAGRSGWGRSEVYRLWES